MTSAWRVRLSLLLAVSAVALAGCTSPSAHLTAPDLVPTTPGPAPVIPTTDDAVGLVNLWRVSNAAGTGTDSWLRLDGGDFLAWTDCGIGGGSWGASDGLFLASVYRAMGAGQHCLSQGGAIDSSLDWLLAATGFRATSSGYELLGADGAVVASLSIDGSRPTQSDQFIDEYTRAPEVTAEIRGRFVEAAPLPAGVEEATEILGRWEPEEVGDGSRPFVQFNDDGSWIGSDGCNGAGGRWTRGDVGLFIATSGATTLVGCLNSPAPGWVSSAARIGAIGDALAFFDATGAKLGEVFRP